jgi:hypothetical protein
MFFFHCLLILLLVDLSKQAVTFLSVYSPSSLIVAGIPFDVSVVSNGLNKTADSATVAVVDVTGTTLG